MRVASKEGDFWLVLTEAEVAELGLSEGDQVELSHDPAGLLLTIAGRQFRGIYPL